MKKELKALLNQDEGSLKINEYFTLRRWTLKKETDLLGRTGDFLKLEMNDRLMRSVMIESRNTEDIINEVSKAIVTLMNETAEDMAKRFEGGII